jgi:tRNA pseudouridine38-40 synthase
MRYFVRISYDGTSFYGWQKQAVSENTVQTQIDKCLSILIRENINSIGCGRTDTGVHAKNFILHFDADKIIEDIKDLVYHLNKMLPKSIVVHELYPVDLAMHARFSATQRAYVYRLKMVKDPFDFHHFYYTYKNTNLELPKLNQLAALVMKTDNFSAFEKTHTDTKTSICKIKDSYWTYDEKQQLYEYHIVANRFLRGMIRLLVGAMLNVCRGKLSIEAFEDALVLQKPLLPIWSIEARGLTLQNIVYDTIPNSEEE